MTGTIRYSRASDKDALKEIWSACFDDSPAAIDDFLSRICPEGRSAVMEYGGKCVSAFHIVSAGLIFPGGDCIGLDYLYALGTLPEMRGHGFGSAAASFCAEASLLRGRIAALVPADAGLRQWYQKSAGLTPAFSVCEMTCTASKRSTDVLPMSAHEYFSARGQMLGDIPHAVLPEKMFCWSERYSPAAFFCSLPEYRGCAFAEKYGSRLVISELLVPDGKAPQAAAELCQASGCSDAVFRTPACGKCASGEGTCGAVLCVSPQTLSLPKDAWFGPFFD